ncbi:carcinoembryonic antigen-related cell adhesion molecule 3-like [Anolis carolinensis]|uniref:carcinoembryonic antigen-related cell adhesion molecule 3-like n=1 Tax=Anolis carolinensis TaxID=28377 RepID=UPI002F2B34F5
MGVLLGGKGRALSTLLAAFVLSVCFFSTEAFMKETSITMKPPRPVEGGKVYLIPQDLSPAPVLCRWFRGESIENNTIAIFYFYPHPYIWDATAFTGREIMKSNCSLEIIDLNYNDTANYTVLIEGLMGSRVGTVELVIEASDPDEPGRGFSRSTVAGIILGCLGAIVILIIVVVLIKRE